MKKNLPKEWGCTVFDSKYTPDVSRDSVAGFSMSPHTKLNLNLTRVW